MSRSAARKSKLLLYKKALLETYREKIFDTRNLGKGENMNVLFLGNGFDINLELPTSYINFLHTVEYIRMHKLTNFKTVGDIWGKECIWETDPKIKSSYNLYKDVYDVTELPAGYVRDMGLLAENNIWFHYLAESINKDIGWIDFEKEISNVIRCFRSTLDNSPGDTIENKMASFSEDHYVVFSLNFFTNGGSNERHSVIKASHSVREEYLLEAPAGSGYKKINKEKIISDLYKSLQDLAKLLQRYLEVFVDEVAEKLIQRQSLVRMNYFSYAEQVITLNYTHSFEKMYASIPVIHLHGDTNNNIVLGVNTDEYDDGESVRTEYIAFKKYYQRIIYGTDIEYLAYIAKLQEENKRIALTVMGHSLDVSDKDIIVELFSLSSDITIVYHNQEALGNYVANLVKIFGKTGLDTLRYEKSLRFIPLEDLDNYAIDYGCNISAEVLSI